MSKHTEKLLVLVLSANCGVILLPFDITSGKHMDSDIGSQYVPAVGAFTDNSNAPYPF
jgi:hypothetical protein